MWLEPVIKYTGSIVLVQIAVRFARNEAEIGAQKYAQENEEGEEISRKSIHTAIAVGMPMPRSERVCRASDFVDRSTFVFPPAA